MTFCSCGRSSVKSCLMRTAPFSNVTMASRSAGFIWSVDVALRRPERAQLVARRHRGHVEVENEQLAVPEPRVAGRRHGKGRLRRGCHVAGGRGGGAHGRRRPRARLAGQPLVLDERDVLRLAVLGDHEVLGGQPFDGTPGGVLHGDVLHDEPRAGAEHRRLIRHLHLSLRRGRSAGGGPPCRCADAVRPSVATSARTWSAGRASSIRTSGARCSAAGAFDSPGSAGRTAGCRRAC